MPEHLCIGQQVNYRYLSFPPGIIKKIDRETKQLLLEVNHFTEKFTRWVHWTSVEIGYVRPEPKLLSH